MISSQIRQLYPRTRFWHMVNLVRKIGEDPGFLFVEARLSILMVGNPKIFYTNEYHTQFRDFFSTIKWFSLAEKLPVNYKYIIYKRCLNA